MAIRITVQNCNDAFISDLASLTVCELQTVYETLRHTGWALQAGHNMPRTTLAARAALDLLLDENDGRLEAVIDEIRSRPVTEEDAHDRARALGDYAALVGG